MLPINAGRRLSAKIDDFLVRRDIKERFPKNGFLHQMIVRYENMEETVENG
ncbi:hypothetical protein Tcan_05054 [Toxocara canis]|uniref:Uncharacterized protein n=1 Tax=Toxocara canis TaxID=6265 RepID=A0A0B2V645_TOXCA|nr:hypothetical protein Tcan_05054 [Toxocara canis]